jgi:hypothetical protein
MANDVAKKTTIAIAASLIGEAIVTQHGLTPIAALLIEQAIVTQHGLTQEDVDLYLKEYLFITALYLISAAQLTFGRG